jgi:D-sedoheptulose 7-phosphate isomerase
MADMMRDCHKSNGVCFFIGNGGSSAMSSHMAEDYTKNGGIRSMAFTDAALLTCFANDYGYDQMYAKAISFYAKAGDIVVAISSSGNSLNIVNACYAAKFKGCELITFSGFKPDNAIRQLGDINFWVPNETYGGVECTHNALMHGVLDLYLEGK